MHPNQSWKFVKKFLLPIISHNYWTRNRKLSLTKLQRCDDQSYHIWHPISACFGVMCSCLDVSDSICRDKLAVVLVSQFLALFFAKRRGYKSPCSQLTILAAIPPAPAVPRRIYLTLATRITALIIWVVNIRSPLIFLLTRILVMSGNNPCGVLINVLIFLLCRISNVWMLYFWWLMLHPSNWGGVTCLDLERNLPAFSVAFLCRHCSQCWLEIKQKSRSDKKNNKDVLCLMWSKV